LSDLDNFEENPEDLPPTPGRLLVFSALMLFVTGAFAVTYALQLLVFIYWTSSMWMAPVTFGVIGLFQVATAALVARGSPSAVVIGLALTGFQGVFAIAWQIYALLMPMISPMGMCWILTVIVPLVLLPLAIPHAIRIARERKELYQG
jgi:hypothetical protein